MGAPEIGGHLSFNINILFAILTQKKSIFHKLNEDNDDSIWIYKKMAMWDFLLSY